MVTVKAGQEVSALDSLAPNVLQITMLLVEILLALLVLAIVTAIQVVVLAYVTLVMEHLDPGKV